MSRLRPMGPTANSAMSMKYGGNVYSEPSQPLPMRYDSFSQFSLNKPLMGRRMDEHTGRMVDDITPNQSFRQLYDLNNAPRKVSSLQNSYPQEVIDFPDVFDMPDQADVMISRIQARQLYPFQVMPLRLTDHLHYNWIECIFNDTTPEAIPEEGVPTLVTQTHYQKGDTLSRWAKGAKMERGAYLTARGRKNFWMQVEQINLGISFRMIHDILCSLIWTESRDTQDGRSSTSMRRPGVASKSVDAYFREDIDRRFMLNKDPNSVQTLVDGLKTDFSNRAPNGLNPNRVIFFRGAQQFYRDLTGPVQGEFWQTGWQDGSSFNPLEKVVDGLTYCESFGVKQGDFNPDHDPFTDEVCVGSFARVNRSLYKDSLRPGVKMDQRALNIKTLNGDTDAIEVMPYNKYIKHAGVWNLYEECVRSKGTIRSSLSNIGHKLFAGNNTYRDLMLQDGAADYHDRVTRICSNERLMRDIRGAHNLGFVDMDVDSGPKPDEKKKEEEIRRDDQNQNDGYYDDVPAWTEGRKQRRRKDDDDDDEEEKQPKKQRGVRSPLDSIFRRYLKKQPGGHVRELLDEYNRIVADNSSSSVDSVAVAWKVLSERLVGGQLVDAVETIKKKGHAKFPLTVIESKVSKQHHWSNTSQEDTEELDQADHLSARWSPHNELLELYLNPRLTVTAELHQGSAALTLSTAHTTLFKVTHEMLLDAIAGNSRVSLTPPASGFDVISKKGRERLLRLQHSANLSFAFQAIREAAEKSDDARKMFVVGSDPTTEQKSLAETLRKVVSVNGFAPERLLSVSRSLKVSPLQWAVKAAVDSSRKVVEALYSNPAISDAKLALVCRPVVSFMLNDVKALKPTDDNDEDDDDSDSSDDDEQTDTSGRAAIAQAIHLRLTPEQQETVKKIASHAETSTTAIMTRNEAHFLKSKSSGTLGHDKAFRASAFNEEDYAALLVYLLGDKVRLEQDPALKLVSEVAQLAELVYSKKRSVFQGVEPMAIYDQLIANMLTKTRSTIDANTTAAAIQTDIVSLSKHFEDTPVPLSGSGVLKPIISLLKAEAQTARAEIEAFQRMDFSELASNVSQRTNFQKGRKEDRKVHRPDEYVFVGADEQETAWRLSEYVVGKRTRPNASGVWKKYVKSDSTTPDLIAAIQIYSDENQGASITETTVEASKLMGNKRNLDLLIEQRWNSKSYLPTLPEAQAILQDRAPGHEVSAAWSHVDRLLASVSLEDCRLHELLVKHDEEPLVGLLYFWPHIRVEGSHVAMVKDGEVGNLMYIEPDSLLSENGQQKLVFYHLSIYFKAMVMNDKALARAYFVYCNRVLGGYNHTAWDPLNEEHRGTVMNSGPMASASGCSMFVVPTLMSRDVRASHMCATGQFPETLPLDEESAKSTKFEVMEDFCDAWGFSTDEYVNPFHDSKKQRVYASEQNSPNCNMLMSQTHQEYFELGTQKWTGLIQNKGHFGPNIYDGCMRAWNGKGKLDMTRIGSTQLK